MNFHSTVAQKDALTANNCGSFLSIESYKGVQGAGGAKR